MGMLSVNINRLVDRIEKLGKISLDEGKVSRLALTKADKLARDYVVSIMKEIGLEVKVDKIGNIFGILKDESNKEKEPIFIGSHIDTVIDAGIYDGCYGVLSGLEVIQTLKENNISLKRPIVCAVFTNEEGVRFQPDMLGSLVYAGGLDIDEALKIKGIDGKVLEKELKDIGYFGEENPGFMKAKAYIELHVEQGPILDKEDLEIGVVTGIQGISWQEIKIKGVANHAGTTPMNMRKDALYIASKINVFLKELACENDCVITVGSINIKPNAINVIPSEAIMTVDLRDLSNKKMEYLENEISEYLKQLSKNIDIEVKRLVRFSPVSFDQEIISLIEDNVNKRQLSYKKMTSGAGHDAQMISRICKTAMIFVPSKDGISHSPKEYTKKKDLENGANILLDTVTYLIE